MERLTKVIGGHVVFPSELVGDLTPDNETAYHLLTRLAAYEDTGLEPEEIMDLCEMDKRTKMAKMLRWEDAERDGRLVVLPPKDYTFTVRGDIVRDVIFANCRAAKQEAEAALEAAK